MASRSPVSAKKGIGARSVTPTKPIVGLARTPNKNVGSRIDTGLGSLGKSGLNTPPPGNSQSRKENLSPVTGSGVQKQKTNVTDSKLSNKGIGNTSVSPTKFPDYTEPKKIQGLVTGRDRKLRDHNKCKIFREVVTNLFETRIEPAKLLYFLENKCKEKKDMFSYDYARDTNVMNLRFCIYLLAEELETIINNLDESHGHNYINSIDAKLTKRNEIINYLLKEKAVTCKLFTKLLSVFMNTVSECADLATLVEGANDFKEKGRFVSKLKNLTNELQIMDEFKSFAKAYFTEKDVNNLVALQRDIKDPMSRDQYLRIIDYPTIFERVDKYQQLLDEYKTLSNDMALKEENYNRLLKKYDQLLKDFTDLTNQGTKQIVNPLGPEDYNLIFAKYKEVKEQERQEQEAAKRASNKKKKSSRSGSKKGSKDGKKKKRGESGSPKREKSKKKTRKRKSSDEDEAMTSDRSGTPSPGETDRDRKRPTSAMKKRGSEKGDDIHRHVKIVEKSDTAKPQPSMGRLNMGTPKNPDPNVTYEYSPNNSGMGTFRGKEPPPPDIDVSHISRKDNSFGEMFPKEPKRDHRDGSSHPPDQGRWSGQSDPPFVPKKDEHSTKEKRGSLKQAEFSQPSISAKKEESLSHHGHSITVTPPKPETPKNPTSNTPGTPPNGPAPPPPPPPKQPTPPLTPKSEAAAKPPTPPQPPTPPKPETPKNAPPPPPPVAAPPKPPTPKAEPPAPPSPKTTAPPPAPPAPPGPPAPPSPKTAPPPPPAAVPPPPGPPPPPPSNPAIPPPPPGLLPAANNSSSNAGNNSSFI